MSLIDPSHTVQFRGCLKEGKSFDRFKGLLHYQYGSVIPLVTVGNCIYFHTFMSDRDFKKFIYMFFERHIPPNKPLTDDFVSVYIFLDFELYTYYDLGEDGIPGQRVMPSQEDASPILEEILKATEGTEYYDFGRRKY
jgi:hypothetical protein